MVIEFLTHEANTSYFFALSFLIFLFVFEVMVLVIGTSFSHAFDSLIDFDIDTDIGDYFRLFRFG